MGEDNKTAVDIALANLSQTRELKGFDAEVQNKIEMLRSVLAYGQSAIKSAVLVNGGAAVAILAFIGNIWTKGVEPSAVIPLASTIGSFAIGTLVAALGSGGAYLTNYNYYMEKNSLALKLHLATAFLVVFSYMLFGLGSYFGYNAFVNQFMSLK